MRRRNIAGTGKGFRRLVSQTAVGTFPVVVLTPGIDQLSSFLQRGEPVFVQTGVAKLAVEALNERVLNGLAWLNETQVAQKPVR